MVRIGSVIALAGVVITVLSFLLASQQGGADPARETSGNWLLTSVGIGALVVGLVLAGFGLVMSRRQLPRGS
jgi:hypothetical protein